MALDLTSITATLYDRIKTAPEGAAVRDLLGAGATSVITQRELPKDLRLLPVRPLLVWRHGVITGEAGDDRRVINTWWVYVEPGAGDRPVNTIVAALEAAYPQIGVVPFGRVRVGPIGQPAEDRTLNLYGRAVQVSYSRRA